jgi:glycosyltransferase involved in cell wall biosynthesis
VIVTDGEQVGIPFALLGRLFGRGLARHMMIVHVVSVPSKERLINWGRLADRIDCYVVYCTSQLEFVRDRLGVRQDRIVLTPFMVDTDFFDPSAVEVPRRHMICSAGLERRDYHTLMRAVDGMDVDVVIAAASPWSRQADATQGERLPENVTRDRFSQSALRELYAESQFVVMPLHEVDFQAGITAILEAMAMERPVVVTRTTGQTDTVVDGATGRYVAPGDADQLRCVIGELLGEPSAVAEMGVRARQWCLEHAEVSVYADRLAAVVARLRSEAV